MTPGIYLLGVLALAHVLEAGHVILEEANFHQTSIGSERSSSFLLFKGIPSTHVCLTSCREAAELEKAIHSFVLLKCHCNKLNYNRLKTNGQTYQKKSNTIYFRMKTNLLELNTTTVRNQRNSRLILILQPKVILVGL